MLSLRTHPGEENLLRFCEGELRARDASQVALHLDACWDCRTHVDDLRKTIGEYVHYRKDTLQPGLPNPPAPWKDLSREFERIRAEQGRRSGPGALFRRPVGWMLLSGAVLLASTTVVLKTLERSERVDVPPQVSTPAETAEHLPDASTSKPQVARSVSEPAVTADDELSVIAALHRVGADLGEPIEVIREKHAIIVNAAGLDSARVEQLRAALSPIAGVTLHLAPRSASPALVESHAPAVESGQKSPFESQFARQFHDRQALQKFIDETLQSSDAMMDRAHALRALADRFPAKVVAQMSPRSVALLTSIREEHAAALADRLAAIHLSMKPVLPSISAPQTREAAGNWQERTNQLFNSAQRVDRLLGALLAPAAAAQPGDSAPADLAAALRQLDAELAAYRQLPADDR